MDIKVIFGKVLREIRTQKKVSQEQLANEAGLDRSYISKLETGIYQPSMTTLFSVSEVLEIAPSKMVEQAYEMYKQEKTI